MKPSIIFIALILLTACTEEKPREVFKTTHAEIEQRFSENGTAAEQFFKNKTVELTDTVNAIKGGGTVVLVDDSMKPYIVNVRNGSFDDLAKVKPGENLTVQCDFVDAGLISWCDIPKRSQ